MSPNQKKDTILIAVDFGTTFSGVSWCHTRTPDVINPVRWPGTTKSLEKVPSVVQYSSKDASKYKWGFSVSPESSTTQAPLRWFKLLLNQDTHDNNVLGSQYPDSHTNRKEKLRELLATLAALPKEKTPMDVVTDYLKGIYTHTLDELKKEYPENFANMIGKEIPLRFVLAVPAVWSDSAKEQTLQAARAAGMNEDYAKITLVSEPEAAAIHCLKVFKKTAHSLKVGDVYVIADCGGGTVDLISYEITAVEPELHVNECVVGTGGLCGSTELNRRFESLVKSKIGESSFNNMAPIARSNMMRHFDEYMKPTFCPPDPTDEEDDFEPETYNCLVPGIEDCNKKGIYRSHLQLSAEDMKGIFDPTFSEITTLVQDQVTNAGRKSGKAVTGVLLVGGFGSSSYLYKHLSTTIKDREGKAVRIIQPADAATAIVRGAVLYGLSLGQGSVPTAHIPSVDNRIARFSYGISASEPFIPGIHPSSKMYYDPYHGELMCAHRMQWFVEKGEVIPNDIPNRLLLCRKCPIGAGNNDLVFPEEIFCSSLDDPPFNESDPGVKSLLVFTADLGGVPRKKHFNRKKAVKGSEYYWEIPMCMLMKYQSASLEFSLEVGGNSCGKGSVLYSHDVPEG